MALDPPCLHRRGLQHYLERLHLLQGVEALRLALEQVTGDLCLTQALLLLRTEFRCQTPCSIEEARHPMVLAIEDHCRAQADRMLLLLVTIRPV